MVTLAELALPRLPAGPSEEDVARLEAIIPDTIGDEAVYVQMLPSGRSRADMDAEDPDVKAFMDALAAQGKSTADILVAAGTTRVRHRHGHHRGADQGSRRVEPPAPVLQGRLHRRLDQRSPRRRSAASRSRSSPPDPAWNAYATGDLAIYALGPDEFLQEYFASLP